GLLAEIGDFRRFAHPRELMSYLGLTPSEYSSGQQQHRGHITKTGNRHARRLLVEAAWHYCHRPRQSTRAARLQEHVPPEVPTRASQSDQLSLPSRRPPDPSTATAMTTNYHRPLDIGHPSQLGARWPPTMSRHSSGRSAPSHRWAPPCPATEIRTPTGSSRCL